MKTRDELYAVLIALPADTLLLPNAAVVEVLSPERLERPSAGTPPWFAGRLTHNDRSLPVVRFEVLNGAPRTEDTRRTRLAVVHAITDRLRAGRYGIICQGYPHLVTLNRAALRRESITSTDHEDLILTRVSIANTSALIPNLEVIEAQLAALESAAAAA